MTCAAEIQRFRKIALEHFRLAVGVSKQHFKVSAFLSSTKNITSALEHYIVLRHNKLLQLVAQPGFNFQ